MNRVKLPDGDIHRVEELNAKARPEARSGQSRARLLRVQLPKGTNLSSIDPGTCEVVQLFNPRQQQWWDDSIWRGAELSGLTPTARATIQLLQINRAVVDCLLM